MDRFTYLTRADDVGCEPYDSIAWAFEVHVKQPDNALCQVAILVGNEDAPERIMFYATDQVSVDSVPLFTWTA